MKNEFYEKALIDYNIKPIPSNATEAMAYVPYQGRVGQMYNPEHGIEVGTLFPVLDKPFLMGGGRKK